MDLSYLSLLLAASGLIVCSLVFFVKKWQSNIDQPLDQKFVWLFTRVSFATFFIVVSFVSLIVVREHSSFGTFGSQLRFDGNVLIGLVSLAFAVPVAFASAMVVISLGKNQDQLTRRELAALDAEETKSARDLIHRTEERFARLQSAYDAALRSLWRLEGHVSNGYEILFREHRDWHLWFPDEFTYFEDKHQIRERISQELSDEYQFTNEGSGIFKKSRKEYDEALKKLIKLRTEEEVSLKLRETPYIDLNCPDAQEFLAELESHEHVLQESLTQLIEVVRDISMDAPSSTAWNWNIKSLVAEDRRSFLHRMRDSVRTDMVEEVERGSDRDLLITLAGLANPSPHNLLFVLEGMQLRLHHISARRSRRVFRSKDRVQISEYFSSLHSVLTMFFVSSRDEFITPHPADLLRKDSFPINGFTYSCNISVSHADDSKIYFNPLGSGLFILGLLIPTPEVLVKGLVDRGIFLQSPFDRSQWFDSILAEKNLYLDRSTEEEVSNHFEMRDTDHTIAEGFDKMHDAEIYESILRRLSSH